MLESQSRRVLYSAHVQRCWQPSGSRSPPACLCRLGHWPL